MTIIRAMLKPADEATVLAVVKAAFSDPTRDAKEELAIVRTTWAVCEAPYLLELVAVDDGTPVAHVAAAPGRIDGIPSAVAGVAPVCVAPSHQGRGIGTELMQTLVETAKGRGWPLLVLLGDPAFYARVGFEPAGSSGLHYAPVGPDNPHFQACALDKSAATPRGEFSYCWEPLPTEV